MYTVGKIAFFLLIFVSVLPVTDNTDAANFLESQAVIDARQEAQLWTTYALNSYLQGHDIQVSVKGGKVTLTGKVAEVAGKELAGQIARHVDRIKTIDNQLVVDADYTPSTLSRGYAEEIDDVTITAAVKSKLLWSKYEDSKSTYIETTAGAVTLRGTTENSESRNLAASLALNTRGVELVKNLLLINYANPSSGRYEGHSRSNSEEIIIDSWITTKVKSTFRYSSNLSDSAIEVNTAKGIVTLKGKLKNDAEHALAVELAQNIRGVKGIESNELRF